MDSLLELFVHVDDFWQIFRPIWHEHLLASGKRERLRDSQLSESESMTIIILFHQAQYRNFKAFYLGYVRRHLKREFPALGELQALRSPDEADRRSFVCLFAWVTGPLHRDFLCG